MRLTSLFNLQLTVVSLRATGRQITIDLENESTYKWEHPSIYLFSGTTDGTLPDPVETGKSEFCKCRGTLVQQ